MLASPGKEIYAHVLFLLYDLFRESPFGIPREAVVEAAEVYLEGEPEAAWAEWVAGEAAAAGEGGGAGAPAPAADTGADARARALAVLRRLQEAGWLDVEVRTNYEQFVTLADYAIQVLEALDRVRTRRRAEYAGYVYGTWAALTSADAERYGALALGEARDRTEQLVKELKLLHHNIKRYTERLLAQERPQDILAMHFLEYKDQVLDRSYHHLKTSDHVAKYRPRILACIDDWLTEPGRVGRAAAEEASRRGIPPEQAEAEVLGRLQYIRQAYASMDDLLEEIDRRNAQYAKASLEQVRYHLSNGRDVEGQMTDLLLYLAAQVTGGDPAAGAALGPAWGELFALYAVETLEDTSLYLPRRRREHRPEPLAARAPTAAERAAARRRILGRAAARLTRERINEFVLAALGERREMRAADLGVETTDDFVRLILVAAFAGGRRAAYEVDFRGEPVQTAGGRFRFKNVTLRRKAHGLDGRLSAPRRP